MFPVALLTLLLVFAITRSPVEAIPLSPSPLPHDRARLKALRDPSMRRQIVANTPLRNDYAAYSIAVGIGSPPTTCDGSANTWVNAPAYVGTITSFCTGQPVVVTYGSGSFSGFECLDHVTVGPGLDILMQSIGVAEESAGFPGFDGVLGIGPAALTLGTMPELSRPYVNPPLEATGQITFGGTDATKYNGNIRYTVILRPTVGIVDCGCTFIFIASDGYFKYQSATRSQYDHAMKLLTTPKITLTLLVHNFAQQAYCLTPNAQIWPRSINTRIGGVEGSIYLVICDLGTISGQKDDFTLGYVFKAFFPGV
ncbi:acid protease [Suillus decipiens]|nr:acid protease [Suillus decipiens]